MLIVRIIKITICTELPAVFHVIYKLNQLTFGHDLKANLVDGLRSKGFVVRSLAAEVDDLIIGHILYTRITIQTENVAIRGRLSLAAMAVLPDFQRRGFGTRNSAT